MNCAAAFSLKFIVGNLNRSWVLSGKYKETRTAALIDAEVGKIPDTMQAAEAERGRRVLEAQNVVFQLKIQKAGCRKETICECHHRESISHARAPGARILHDGSGRGQPNKI